MRLGKISFIFFFFFFFSCTEEFSSNREKVTFLGEEDITLEDIKRAFQNTPEISKQSLQNYISLYENFKEIQELLNANRVEEVSQAPRYKEFSREFSRYGYNLEEYILLGRKIYTLYIFVTREKNIGFSQSIEELKRQIQEHEKILANPQTPESAKEILRETIQDLEKMIRKYELAQSDKKLMEKRDNLLRKYRKKLIEKVCDVQEYKLIKEHWNKLSQLYESSSEQPKLLYLQ